MRTLAAVTIGALACFAASAQVRQERSAAAGLEAAFRPLMGAQPAWIGYTVPSTGGNQQTCNWSEGLRPPGPVHLEPTDQVQILYRVEQSQVVKIRVISTDCELDAAGVPIYWLKDVRPAQSVALLSTFVTREDKVSGAAVTAIALHGDPAADQALEKFAAAGQPDALREKAIFWFGASRGRSGFEKLRHLVREDTSDRIRDRAVFALSVSKEPEAVPEIIRVARDDRSAHVRGQALFWLAQKAGKQATETIADAIEKDPETEVKKRAVFALQQLPNGDGVPMLIQVAKTNKNPAVRKQAMFWLGQSKDPRALQFFEAILK